MQWRKIVFLILIRIDIEEGKGERVVGANGKNRLKFGRRDKEERGRKREIIICAYIKVRSVSYPTPSIGAKALSSRCLLLHIGSMCLRRRNLYFGVQIRIFLNKCSKMQPFGHRTTKNRNRKSRKELVSKIM